MQHICSSFPRCHLADTLSRLDTASYYFDASLPLLLPNRSTVLWLHPLMQHHDLSDLQKTCINVTSVQHNTRLPNKIRHGQETPIT